MGRTSSRRLRPRPLAAVPFAVVSAACGPAEGGPGEPFGSFPCDACDGDCLVEHIEAADDNSHVIGGYDYPDPPPTSGPHDPCWADWGSHTDEVPAERWVHNLEHGGVVFLWNCPDECGDEAGRLRELSRDVGPLTLATRYSGMEPGFAAVAWEWRLLLGCVEPTVLTEFYGAHVDRAPESSAADPPDDCSGSASG